MQHDYLRGTGKHYHWPAEAIDYLTGAWGTIPSASIAAYINANWPGDIALTKNSVISKARRFKTKRNGSVGVGYSWPEEAVAFLREKWGVMDTAAIVAHINKTWPEETAVSHQAAISKGGRLNLPRLRGALRGVGLRKYERQ